MRRKQRRMSGLGLALVMVMAACGGSSAPDSAPAVAAPDSDPAPAIESTVAVSPADVEQQDVPDEPVEPVEPDGPAIASEPYTISLPGGALLSVPAGAPEGITATAVDTGAPDGFAVVASFELEPAGLTFDEPVLLTVPLVEPDANTLVVYSGVLTDADGTEEFVEGAVGSDGTATVDIEHFSTIVIRSVTAEQDVPVSVIPVGEGTTLGFDPASKLLDVQMRLEGRSTPEKLRGLVEVEVFDAPRIICIGPGNASGIAVLNGPSGQFFGAQVSIDLVCEIPLGNLILVTSDDVVNDENHTDKERLAVAEWFSAWLVRFITGFEGMAASVVDVGCDGIGAGDLLLFPPEMILPDGSTVLGLERFGCNAMLLLPTDSDVSAVTYPLTLSDTPLQRADGSWTIAGEFDELGASFVVDPNVGEIARWEVTGQDGTMPLVP